MEDFMGGRPARMPQVQEGTESHRGSEEKGLQNASNKAFVAFFDSLFNLRTSP